MTNQKTFCFWTAADVSVLSSVLVPLETIFYDWLRFCLFVWLFWNSLMLGSTIQLFKKNIVIHMNYVWINAWQVIDILWKFVIWYFWWYFIKLCSWDTKIHWLTNVFSYVLVLSWPFFFYQLIVFFLFI